MGGIGQLQQQQVTINALSDDVLLKIFKSFVDDMHCGFENASNEWHTLVHVCRRWRTLLFTFPRHLNLQLFCSLPERSVKGMLDIWPELPLYIYHCDFTWPEDTTDYVVAALRLNHRVSGIHLEETSASAWKKFEPLMQHPFPALTHLWLDPFDTIKASRSLLGGSAPHLQEFNMTQVTFPALPELLLSATNLVLLWYNHVPRPGYISPQAMINGLSALIRLRTLSLTFLKFQPPLDTAIKIPSPHMRTLLPTLLHLSFQGFAEYMEVLVAHIDAPLLQSIEIKLFHQEVLEVSELAKFVRRSDKLSLADLARVTFDSDRILVALTVDQSLLVECHLYFGHKILLLELECYEWEFRPSYLAHFCASCFPTFSPFKALCIGSPTGRTNHWRRVIDDLDVPWLELLRLFNTVKLLCLFDNVAHWVAQGLRGLPAEWVTEVLPAMDAVFIRYLEPFGPVMKAISEFADARQLSGCPVSIHDWVGKVHEEGL